MATETRKIIQNKLDYYLLANLDSQFKLINRENYIKKKEDIKRNVDQETELLVKKLEPINDRKSYKT